MSKIECPWCEYVLNNEDMSASKKDLWAICPQEREVELQCPHCEADFVVLGGYTPFYQTFTSYAEYEETV